MLPKSERAEILAQIAKLTPPEQRALEYDWTFWGRPKQQWPEPTLPNGKEWFIWVLLAGRGFGKTRTAVECISQMLRGPSPLIAPKDAPEVMTFVADTPFDMRQYLIEGVSGFENIGPPEYRPVHEPSKKTLTWPNGCKALLFSAEDPETLRGASGSFFYWDELAKAKKAREGWSNMLFGMREKKPRGLITTTPRPPSKSEGGALLREIIKRDSTAVTTGSTYENRSNLSEVFYREVIEPLEGTRLARQEVLGEILDDVPGALWTWEIIDRARKNNDGAPITREMVPPLRRKIIGVDPSGATSSDDDSHDAIGIILAGIDAEGTVYVLKDSTMRDSPLRWAREVCRLYDFEKADRVVGEQNFGGALVEHTIRNVDRNVSYRAVHASRGKVVRAEPIAALYEQGRVKHVGQFPELEEQMTLFASTGYIGDGSPDRVDALVWAITELVRIRPGVAITGRSGA